MNLYILATVMAHSYFCRYAEFFYLDKCIISQNFKSVGIMLNFTKFMKNHVF